MRSGCSSTPLPCDPTRRPPRFNSGPCAEVGDFQSAEAHFRAALRLDPHDLAALSQLADLCRERLPGPDLDALYQVLTEHVMSPANAAALHFGLAHVLEAREAYGLAAEQYQLANSRRREVMTARGEVYRPEVQEWFVDGLIAVLTPEFFDRVRGFGLGSKRPIFIFGLPRSGTTLIEQILASHGRVYGGGELTLVRDALRSLPNIMRRAENPLACLLHLDQETTRVLAKGTSNGSRLSIPQPIGSPTRCPRTSSRSA